MPCSLFRRPQRLEGSQTSLDSPVTRIKTVPALADALWPTGSHPVPLGVTPADVNQHRRAPALAQVPGAAAAATCALPAAGPATCLGHKLPPGEACGQSGGGGQSLTKSRTIREHGDLTKCAPVNVTASHSKTAFRGLGRGTQRTECSNTDGRTDGRTDASQTNGH